MKTLCFASLLALVAAAGFAQTPTDLPADLTQLENAIFAARGGATPAACSAFASCAPYASVSCSTSGAGTCSGVDRNCAAGQPGYARCGTTYTYCPACPSTNCTEGAYRYLPNGECCPGDLAVIEEWQCVNDSWTPTGYWYCDGSCEP